MAHLVTVWDNEAKTVMRVTYQPGWSWDDLENNLPLEEQMLNSVDHRVDVIADFRGTDLPFGAFSRLPKIAQSPPYTHRNSGMMVMVASPGFMQDVVAVYKRLYGHADRLIVVGELDAARKIISDHRQAPAETTPEAAAASATAAPAAAVPTPPAVPTAVTPGTVTPKPPDTTPPSLEVTNQTPKLAKPLQPGPAPQAGPKPDAKKEE